jgi:hypothetical protein
MHPGNQIHGVVGLIKWGYYDAARIERYTVTRTRDDRRWSLRANIVQADKFKMAQKPLLFVAPHEKGDWRWPITDLEFRGDGPIRATLGPPLP